MDALLDVADTLDWLTDTGDLNEVYQPPAAVVKNRPEEAMAMVNNSTSVSTLPDVDEDSNVDTVVPPLPSLFEGAPEPPTEKLAMDTTATTSTGMGLHRSPSEPNMDHLEVFDTPMEEHDFVTAILETTTESSDHLSGLA